MKKRLLIIGSVLLVLAILTGISGCKKSTTAFELKGLTSGATNMNGGTTPNNISPNPTIVATFSIDVDASSVTGASITLVRTYDNQGFVLTFTTSGTVITIVPEKWLGTGADFQLTFNGIKSTAGDIVASSPIIRYFKTEGSFIPPTGLVAYWNFENNANDQVGAYNPSAVVDITYTDSYKPAAGKAASFNGGTSIIEIPNGDSLCNTSDFTIAFWIKTNSVGHVDASGNPKGHFVIGLGAWHGFQFEINGSYSTCKLAANYSIGDSATASQDLVFDGSGKYNGNGGFKGFTFCKDLTGSGGAAVLLKDVWAHVVCVYESSTKLATIYINGEKMKEQDYDLYDPPMSGATGLKWNGNPPEEYPVLAFGFIQSRLGTLWNTETWGNYSLTTSNHFGGLLDDVMIFHKALSAAEVDLIYSSSKP